MNKIYKQEIKIGLNTLKVPDASKFLSAKYQGATLMIWYMFNEQHESSMIGRTVAVVGTGHYFELSNKDNMEHINTVQDGPFVWHIFAETE